MGKPFFNVKKQKALIMLNIKKNWKTVLFIILLIGFFITFGFIREFLFVNINCQLAYLYYDYGKSCLDKDLYELSAWTYDELMDLKWHLTILFTVLYLILSVGTINTLFHNRPYLLWTIAGYLGVMLLSGFLYMGGNMIGFPHEGYRMARVCMGVLQSPLPLMALIPAFKLAKLS